MSEKPLLLSSAKSGVMVSHRRRTVWMLFAVLCGLFVILIGVADISSRLSKAALGPNAGSLAFAPLGTLDLTKGSAPNSTSSAATTTPLIPARLSVPTLGINAAVQLVGKKADGTMGTPSKFDEVAWYSLGPKPGAPGSAVNDGHVNNALTTGGVFEHLSQIKIGDLIMVSDASGSTLSYAVTDVEEYAPDASTDSIFSTEGPSQLVLITCDGDWVSSEHQFDKRLVVVAKLK